MIKKMAFYGEENCSSQYADGRNCTNVAYYRFDGELRCGLHSKNKGDDKDDRVKLPSNPNKWEIIEDEIKRRQSVADKHAEQNNGVGLVKCQKLKMMKNPVFSNDTFMAVFPNFKHENRKDGFGCSELSPKSLGPVEHKMKNVPVALNLENYHQGSKFFSTDVDTEDRPTIEGIRLRNNIYRSEIPFRHKHTLISLDSKIPLYSLYRSLKTNKYRKYLYIECRFFYCYWYEKLVVEEKQYKKLQKYHRDGYNLDIIGYDGRELEEYNKESLYREYLNTSSPFGHELVLLTMLLLEKNDRPWWIYYNKHRGLYDGMFEDLE